MFFGNTPFTVKYGSNGNGNQKIMTFTQEGSKGNVLQLQGVSGQIANISYCFPLDDKQYLLHLEEL